MTVRDDADGMRWECDAPGCVNASTSAGETPRGWLTVLDSDPRNGAVHVCSWRCLALLASSVVRL